MFNLAKFHKFYADLQWKDQAKTNTHLNAFDEADV